MVFLFFHLNPFHIHLIVLVRLYFSILRFWIFHLKFTCTVKIFQINDLLIIIRNWLDWIAFFTIGRVFKKSLPMIIFFPPIYMSIIIIFFIMIRYNICGTDFLRQEQWNLIQIFSCIIEFSSQIIKQYLLLDLVDNFFSDKSRSTNDNCSRYSRKKNWKYFLSFI